MRTLTGFFVAAAVAATLILPAAAMAQSPAAVKTLVVLGSGEVKENVAAAREKAIADALVAALAKVAADLLPAGAMVDQFALLNDAVFGRPNEFVQNYRVLTEHKTQSHYRVLVEATVALDRLTDKLGTGSATPVAAAPQRFLLLLSEQVEPGTPLEAWWMGQAEGPAQAAMAQVLRQKALEVIAPAQPVEATFWRPELTDDEAVEIGRRLGAQAVVVGTATTAAGANVMGVNIRAFQALVKIRVLRVDPAGQIGLGAKSADATGADAVAAGREALTKAGEAAGAQILEMVGGQSAAPPAMPTTVELVVSGSRSLADLVQFRRVLGETPGVTGVKMVEMRTEQAVLAVDYKDRGPKLAEALLKRTHTAFAIRIAETKAQQLRIELVPAEAGGAAKP